MVVRVVGAALAGLVGARVVAAVAVAVAVMLMLVLMLSLLR